MQYIYFLIGPILFLYYEESLVSSNLNSKLFRFPIFKKQNNLSKFLYPSLENLTTQNSTLLFFTLKCCCDIHKETWSSVLDNGRFILEFAWSLLFDRMNYATIKLLQFKTGFSRGYIQCTTTLCNIYVHIKCTTFYGSFNKSFVIIVMMQHIIVIWNTIYT